MRLIDVRNEQSAGYMAEVHGRLTKGPGVVAVSSAVAHANAMTGVVDAYLDGAPMLLLTGAAALRTSGLGHFQDIDQVALASPATKYARVIDRADRAVQILDKAGRAATDDKPGPVYLTFSMDVQETEVSAERMISATKQPAAVEAAGAGLESAAAVLGKASQPLIVAGSGLYYAGEGEAACAFAKEFSVPLAVPIWGRGVVEEDLEAFVGVIGAATGGAVLRPGADCIVMAGLRWITGWPICMEARSPIRPRCCGSTASGGSSRTFIAG